MLSVGSFADLAVLSEDFFAVETVAIRAIESVLIMVDGKVAYATQNDTKTAPEMPAVSPDGSPVATYGVYHNSMPSPPIIGTCSSWQPNDESRRPPAGVECNQSTVKRS